MSVSTDAILAYGIDLGEDRERFPWAKHKWDGDFEEWVVRELLGLKMTYMEDGYFDKRKELLASFPVDLIMHCHGDYPMWFLAVRGTVHEASRGYPERIEEFPEVHDGKRAALKYFAEKHGLKYDKEKVGWHLFSLWF